VITSGTGVGANIGRPEAGKTGTSQDWRDAWFVGFTPDILTAVWVGNDGGAPMAKVTGGELPAEIWRKFMTVAEKPLPPRDFPWLVQEPTAAPSAMTVADQQSPYEDEPATVGADGAQADADDAPAAAEQDQPPPPVVEPAPARPYARGGYEDSGSAYARGGYDDRSNPYARDPYARDPYGDPGADGQGDGQDERAPPQPRAGRGWREEPPPDDQDDAPPPRYQDRPPYSAADGDPRDGY
jgi:membrane peptidoglycan carboxypeptidase